MRFNRTKAFTDVLLRVKTRQFYIRDLHHVRAEFEDARLPKGRPVAVRHSEDEFPGFSGRGYMQGNIQQVSVYIVEHIVIQCCSCY